MAPFFSQQDMGGGSILRANAEMRPTVAPSGNREEAKGAYGRGGGEGERSVASVASKKRNECF